MYPHGIAATIGAAACPTLVEARAVRGAATRRTLDHAVFSATRSMACALECLAGPTPSSHLGARYSSDVRPAAACRNRHVLLHTNTPVMPRLSRVRSQGNGSTCHEKIYCTGRSGRHAR
jgi:hypothetical protein